MKTTSPRRWLDGFALASGLLLLWLFARRVDWGETLALITSLGPAPFLLYIGVNVGVALFFGLRWWLLLRGLGVGLPLLRVAKYRLIGATVSLLTPGPQFGGEPAQVWLLVRRASVAPSPAVASVALDRMLELTLNLGFLIVGLLYTLGSGLLGVDPDLRAVALALIPLALPVVGLLTLWWRGGSLARWIAGIFQRAAPHRQDGLASRLLTGLGDGESAIHRVLRRNPRLVAAGGLISLANWAVLLADFWLATRLVGMDLNGLQFAGFVVAARLAILLPIPAGLGALEASQILAAQSVGVNPALGLALVVLFRARDVVLAVWGVALAWRESRRTSVLLQPRPVPVSHKQEE